MAEFIPNSAIFHDLALVLSVYVSTPPERVARRMAELLTKSAIARLAARPSSTDDRGIQIGANLEILHAVALHE